MKKLLLVLERVLETRAQYTVRLLYPSILPGTPPRCGCSASTGILYCVYYTALYGGLFSQHFTAVFPTRMSLMRSKIYIYIYINDIESDYPASRPSRLQYERRVISRPGYEPSLMIIYDGSNAPDYTNLTPADKNPSNRAFRLERKVKKKRAEEREREHRVWQTRERETEHRVWQTRERETGAEYAMRVSVRDGGRHITKTDGFARIGQIIVRVSV